MIYIATLLVAFGLTYLLTPLAGRLGVRWGLADQPGGRRQHRGVIPRTGGVAFFLGFFITVLILLTLDLFLPPTWQDWFPTRNDTYEWRRLLALLGGGLFCVLAGLLDDRYELGSLPQYGVQIIA